MTDAAVANVPELTGYDIHWNHSQKKGYSGVAILVSNDVSRLGLTVERIVPGMGDDIADAEGRVLTAYLTCGLAVVNAYVPNSGGKLARLPYRTETFEPRMRSFVNELAAKYSVLYCGDLNVAHEVIDIHNSKGNQKNAGHTPQERGQFGMLLKSGAGWVDCWRRLYNDYSGYTFYSRRFGPRLKNDKKGWRLDYHVIDKKSFDKDIVHDCFVRPNVDGSDHYPLVVDYEIKKLLQ